jgi:DNA-binding transcriptional regulator YhcF (GntR family)
VALDPDDPRPPYKQVAGDLRAAIVSRRLAPGDRLPSGAELARRYGVARMTVQQAIRVLRDESLVVTRQGSGVFVRSLEPAQGIRPHLSRAFRADHVSIDFAGTSGVALENALGEAVEQLLSGRVRPRTVAVRALVPDSGPPWTLPGANGQHDRGGADRPDPDVVAELEATMRLLRDASRRGLVDRASTELRVHPLVPLFTLYVVNGVETFFALHPVERRTVVVGDVETPAFDVRDDEADLIHRRAGESGSVEARAVVQARQWFDSVWGSLARLPG